MLSPTDRSAGLAAAARVRRGELIATAESVAATNHVEVLAPPSAGSVMVELETPIGAFCLTEVVVTTCKVRIGEREGWSAVMGWDDEASLAAAVLDAKPAMAESLAASALSAETAAQEEEALAIGATRVER